MFSIVNMNISKTGGSIRKDCMNVYCILTVLSYFLSTLNVITECGLSVNHSD